jgi:hypothetical protein
MRHSVQHQKDKRSHAKTEVKENMKDNLETSFTPIAWILDIICRTLVNQIFLLKKKK